MSLASNNRSTQTLTQQIKLNNKLDPHISIKDQISSLFKDTKVYATSFDYDNTPDSKKSGVSCHIHNNAEKFRSRLVRHEGKEKIMVMLNGLLSPGALEDWMKLQEKVIQLRKLNLELDFWLDRLEPVVWKLIETYRGEIDEDFLGRIAKIDRIFGSGGMDEKLLSL
ncbi:12589_t:CDS:2 [Racocetra persica]|uniref:12589_t:CDS:1 n=1 Tax=Racocetra persica TaxID=160502 RepID=A0ACA9MGJ9_9GLOM|nr:12589_t:CDS:2 [Racocetra persica]